MGKLKSAANTVSAISTLVAVAKSSIKFLGFFKKKKKSKPKKHLKIKNKSKEQVSIMGTCSYVKNEGDEVSCQQM